MNIPQKISSLFSPLDVVVIEKEYQALFSKSSNPDVPSECMQDAAIILGTGQFFDRNPTVWKVFQGDRVEVGSSDWVHGIQNLFRLDNQHEVNEIDNDTNHLKITVKFEILAINAKDLSETVFSGVKCAFVQTAFGKFQLVAQ